METYNYNSLNKIINNQYSQIKQEPTNQDNFYSQLFSMYNNPSYDNLNKGFNNIFFNPNQSKPYDDRNTYTYISDI
jgi:hypothetical protein